MVAFKCINSFHTAGHVPYPIKTSENTRKSVFYVSKGYRPVMQNGLIHCIIVDDRIADITASIACFVQLLMKLPGMLRMEIFNVDKK